MPYGSKYGYNTPHEVQRESSHTCDNKYQSIQSEEYHYKFHTIVLLVQIYEIYSIPPRILK